MIETDNVHNKYCGEKCSIDTTVPVEKCYNNNSKKEIHTSPGVSGETVEGWGLTRAALRGGQHTSQRPRFPWRLEEL